jgi:hypothetical protein
MMGHNEDMTTEPRPDDPSPDLDALEASLVDADAADAPESADAIADALNELLDRTAAEPQAEESS